MLSWIWAGVRDSCGSSGTVERLDTRKIRPLNEFFYKLRACMALFFFIIGRVHVNNTFMENSLLR